MPAVLDNGDQIDPLAKPKSLFVPKGTEFIMYTGALHYNREWRDLLVYAHARVVDCSSLVGR